VFANQKTLTLIVIVSLALGIGANTAIFSLVSAFIFRPLPVDRPEEIVVVFVRDQHTPLHHPLSYPDHLDYRKQSVFSDVTALMAIPLNVASGRTSERVWGELVAANYFSMLGIEPVMGRLFQPDDDRAEGASPVVVVSQSFWQSRFGDDSSIDGKTLTINGNPFTIVGVVPKSFPGTYFVGFSADLWVPTSMHQQVTAGTSDLLTNRSYHSWRILGRLAPGTTVAQAQAALTTLAAQLEKAYPETNKGHTLTVIEERRSRPEPDITGNMDLAAIVFTGVAGFVLLIACANVANLLLARATVRHREIAVRQALGANRRRLIRQLLTENLLLAVMGGAVGLLVAYWTTQLIAQLRMPTDIPIFMPDLTPDWRVLTFTLVLTLVTGIIFGLLPALQSSRLDLASVLKGLPPAVASRVGRFRLLDALVVVQVALSAVLLVCAGLFLRSFVEARRIDVGFTTRNALLASIDVGLQGYEEAQGRQFYRDLLQRLRSAPGVEAATLAHYVPLDFVVARGEIYIDGREVTAGPPRVGVGWSIVDHAYFDVMGIPLVQGRGFTPADEAAAEPVAIVNETMAKRYWPNQQIVGRTLRIGTPDAPAVRVVGVAKDGKYRLLGETPRAFMYLPLAQQYSADVQIVLRTAGDPESVANTLQREVRALDPSLPVYGIRTLDQLLGGRAMLGPRMALLFTGVLGALGLSLAVIGLYGVIAYAVNRRMRELGIRVALGAPPEHVVRLVVRRGLWLAGLGLLIGGLAAFALQSVLTNLLYVSPTDRWTLAGVALVLVSVTLLASYVPARRAARVNPTITLRSE